MSGVQSLKDSLSSFRNEEKMDQFLQEARKYCTDQGLVVDDFDQVDQQHPSRPKRRRTIPSYFNDGTFYVLIKLKTWSVKLKQNFQIPALEYQA